LAEFHVFWEVDVESKTAEDAAAIALEMMRDPESIATVFKVGKRGKGPLKLTTYKEIDAAHATQKNINER